jgi:signal transduction histidine kinase
MIRRIDLITAYGRWLALVPVLTIVLLTPSSQLKYGFVTALAATLAMFVVATIPVVWLLLHAFPGWVASVSIAADCIFCLVMLFLCGPGVFLYCFVPVLAVSARFEWKIGLYVALGLSIGYVLIVSIRGGLGGMLDALVAAFCHLVALILVSLLGGLLLDSVKREPPLNRKEVRDRELELARCRAAAERSRAFCEMAGTLGATLNPNRILDAILEISAVGFAESDDPDAPLGMRPGGAVVLFAPEGMYVAASHGLGHDETGVTLAGERGLLGQVLKSGEPVVRGSLAEDPELQQFAAFRRCGSAAGIPLRAGLEIYGVALFASPRQGAFDQEYVELLCAVSNQAAAALTNAHLYQDLQREKEHIVSVEEEARTKLARDLHDGPTQSVSAIAMRLNYVRLLLGRDPDRVKDELFRLENLARRTTREIRTLLFTLRPLVLETQGLAAAVEQLVGQVREVTDFSVHLEMEDIEGQLDVSTQTVAWFITEECLTNVRKHANAENVNVRMSVQNGYFYAEIQDDGDGFDVEATMADYDQRGSYGLLGLQERAALVNGRTTIESSLGKGTKVMLVVPLSRDAD